MMDNRGGYAAPGGRQIFPRPTLEKFVYQNPADEARKPRNIVQAHHDLADETRKPRSGAHAKSWALSCCAVFLSFLYIYYSLRPSIEDAVAHLLSSSLQEASPLRGTSIGHTVTIMTNNSCECLPIRRLPPANGILEIVTPFMFSPLPLGSIAPLGWMSDQMNLMADGLAGHEKDFYHYVNDSSWLGGSSEYSPLNEGFPYWFNGIVPLAYGVNDTRVKGQVYDALDYVLDHQQADGWLGPETTNSTRDLWARFPLFLSFTQILEADPGQAQKLIPAMYRFVNLMHGMLQANLGFIDYWGEVRYQDMIISLQWLYENAPGNHTQLLFDTMSLLRERGRDWADYYGRSTYLFNDLDTVEPEIDVGSPTYPWVHGVNAAQSLKAGAVIYRYTSNQTELQSARDAVNWTLTYHGDVAGSIIGDEREVGLSPSRGSELCTAVEIMYSLSYMYQLLGDKSFADRCELAAFNVLPAMLTSDQWARQYLTLANQPFSYSLEQPVPFFNAGPDGIIYGIGKDTAI